MGKKLTIVSISYNQEKFIKRALDSFIMQETDFEYEIIVADDCSSDNTPEIIDSYAKKYPDLIKPILRDENLGVMRNFVDALSFVNSEYVVFCEGDDYFTDFKKMQKQVDFLDKNKDCTICFHPVKVIFGEGSYEDYVFPKMKKVINKSFKDLLRKNFMQTNSVMYRWQFNDKDIKEFLPVDMLPGDWYLHLLHAKEGKIGFIDEVMSVYQKHSEGIWYEASLDISKFNYNKGLQQLKFYKNVAQNIAEDSQQYRNSMVLPFAKNLFNVFVKERDFSKLEELFEVCPQCYDVNPDKKYDICSFNDKIQKLYNQRKTHLLLIFGLLILLILSVCFNLLVV